MNHFHLHLGMDQGPSTLLCVHPCRHIDIYVVLPFILFLKPHDLLRVKTLKIHHFHKLHDFGEELEWMGQIFVLNMILKESNGPSVLET